jgi:hypothetical protein
MPLLGRLYLSGCHAPSWQALAFCVSCLFVGFTFIFSCKIGIFYGSAEVDQEKMRTTDLEITDFDIQILIMPKWTRSNS